MEMAKVAGSGLVVLGTSFGVGTGTYDVIRWNLDCFWMPNSARGPPPGPVVWMETARPWKQGMVDACAWPYVRVWSGACVVCLWGDGLWEGCRVRVIAMSNADALRLVRC